MSVRFKFSLTKRSLFFILDEPHSIQHWYLTTYQVVGQRSTQQSTSWWCKRSAQWQDRFTACDLLSIFTILFIQMTVRLECRVPREQRRKVGHCYFSTMCFYLLLIHLLPAYQPVFRTGCLPFHSLAKCFMCIRVPIRIHAHPLDKVAGRNIPCPTRKI